MTINQVHGVVVGGREAVGVSCASKGVVCVHVCPGVPLLCLGLQNIGSRCDECGWGGEEVRVGHGDRLHASEVSLHAEQTC